MCISKFYYYQMTHEWNSTYFDQYTCCLTFIIRLITNPCVTPALTLTLTHYSDVIMSTVESQITSLTIVYSTVYSDQRKTSKLCVTGLCEVNSLVATEFPKQRASNKENVSIWRGNHVNIDNSVDSIAFVRCYVKIFILCIYTYQFTKQSVQWSRVENGFHMQKHKCMKLMYKTQTSQEITCYVNISLTPHTL